MQTINLCPFQIYSDSLHWSLYNIIQMQCKTFPFILIEVVVFIGPRADHNLPMQNMQNVQNMQIGKSKPTYIHWILNVRSKGSLFSVKRAPWGTFFGPYFSFLMDNGNENIRSAFFQKWVDASNIPFWGLWKGTMACLFFDIVKLS